VDHNSLIARRNILKTSQFVKTWTRSQVNELEAENKNNFRVIMMFLPVRQNRKNPSKTGTWDISGRYGSEKVRKSRKFRLLLRLLVDVWRFGAAHSGY
jgi:hypothetical protein